MFDADINVLGLGIKINIELAEQANPKVDNCIKVNRFVQTTNEDIYAIDDFTNLFNPYYGQNIHLESIKIKKIREKLLRLLVVQI